MLLLLQWSSAEDVIIIMIVQGAITLHSDLKYDNEMRSSRLILNTLHLMNPFLLLLIQIVKVFHQQDGLL